MLNLKHSLLQNEQLTKGIGIKRAAIYAEVFCGLNGEIQLDDHSRPIPIDHPNTLVLWVLH